MKEQESIPTSKVKRAGKFIKTGAKVGGNYLKHFTKKAFNPKLDRSELDEKNAADIYDSLSELKGSALKVAQMMSSDQNILPQAYIDKFALAQYKAPPLSYPLVIKTFKKYFGKSPDEIFDTFTKKAVNAASIGQVHQATLKGQKLAIKIQYPGVADSISSDLKMVKPIAKQMFNLKEADMAMYMKEVEDRLLEETDYTLELQRSQEISEACDHFENIFFPKYFPEYSSNRILTMEWIDGSHLDEFLRTNPSQDLKDHIGQNMWDFFQYQVQELKQVHADPHPGNFILREDGTMGVIDFGCVKVIPEEFYEPYFQLLDPEIMHDKARMLELFYEMEFLLPEDSEKEVELFSNIFVDVIGLVSRPFHEEEFDFSDDSYFKEIAEMGEEMSKNKEIRRSKRARGSADGIYLNRTYFGLYNYLNKLGAKVRTRDGIKLPSAG